MANSIPIYTISPFTGKFNQNLREKRKFNIFLAKFINFA